MARLYTVSSTPSYENNHSYTDDPDVILMLDFQKGNTASFESLLHKYYKRIYNFCYRMVSNREAAEDLTQTVFLKVHNAAPSYTPQAKFQTWLYTIARNVCLNELRRGRRKFVSIDGEVSLEEGEVKRQFADPSAVNPEKELAIAERQASIRAAIDELPENQRLAVILRRYEDLSYEQIAETMGTTVKAVKSLLSRAKENLRVKLARLIDT